MKKFKKNLRYCGTTLTHDEMTRSLTQNGTIVISVENNGFANTLKANIQFWIDSAAENDLDNQRLVCSKKFELSGKSWPFANHKGVFITASAPVSTTTNKHGDASSNPISRQQGPVAVQVSKLQVSPIVKR